MTPVGGFIRVGELLSAGNACFSGVCRGGGESFSGLFRVAFSGVFRGDFGGWWDKDSDLTPGVVLTKVVRVAGPVKRAGDPGVQGWIPGLVVLLKVGFDLRGNGE